MREIQASTITDVVEKLCIEANYHLPEDVKCAITGCRACEDGEIAKGVLDKIVENYEIADAQNVPICQDTGMACVFLEIGQDVHIAGLLKRWFPEPLRRQDKYFFPKNQISFFSAGGNPRCFSGC